ncbi:TERF1-interacting nuclear factor 2 [Bagarius yarrelli]|uniref:TERF1-interacting nuclear factor 2 n=1 Tax=Bagarius yarrelli TaxID=175774 RepID=A0A556TQT8_BAGYA|nr:TERF1-interacting nuclear factor 2 [Bagarius yarrelli]
MLIRARDIKRFEQVMEFLNVTHTLLPQLVTPIKHMKIMFGLKTLVIMRMLWDDQSVESITNKIAKFFPDSIPQYQRSSRRHIELMQKAQRDFRNFAQLLTRKPEMRKNYIKNMMEQQYGERYIMKLEERLLHYLEELNKALPQPTYIEQVLKQSGPLNGREELLQQIFTCNSVSPSTALKKLLRCAHKPPLEEAEEDWLSQASSQSAWINRDKSLEKHASALKKQHVLEQPDKDPCLIKEQHPQTIDIRLVAKKKTAEDDLTECLCTKHGKRMKSILQECSEEQKIQDDEAELMQVECTLVPSHPPLVQSSPQGRSSASSQHDSSSTNISLSLQPESLGLSVDEERQVVPSRLMASSQTLFAEENSFNCLSGQKRSNSTSPHPEHSVHLVTSSLTCLDQPFLSQTSSSSTNISSFPENRLTPKSPSTKQGSSVTLSVENMCLESSYHLPVSSSSSPPPSSSAAPALTLTESQNVATVSLDSNGMLESNSTLAGKPKLSLDTQAFLLMCKWLQPQVKLYKLGQNEGHQPTLSSHAPERSSVEEEKDEDVFDVNLLYSDSESDPHDSDDSDYIPFKRHRYK